VLGVLSNRFSARLLLTVFPALLATGALIIAYVSTVNDAALVFALAGVGHAACWAPVVVLVQQWVKDRYRGTVLALATMGSGVGIAAWSLWLPAVVENSSYRMGWMQMGFFGLFVTGLSFILVRNPDREAPMPTGMSTSPHHPPAPPYRHLLVSGNIWLVGMSYARIGFAMLVPFTLLGAYATEELYLNYAAVAVDFFPKSVAGSVIGLWPVFMRFGSAVSPIICGWTIDRYGSFTLAFYLAFAIAVLSILFLFTLRAKAGALQ
jgi:sugar phosphate permease